MRTHLAFSACLVLMVWLCCAGPARAQPYLYQDLGSLGGGWSCSNAINSAGQVVGQSTTGGGLYLAYVWDPQTRTMQVLEDLGGGFSCAYAINNLGQFAGTSALGPDQWHAVLWDANRQIQDLGDLGGAGISEAWTLNDHGTAAGYLTKHPPGSPNDLLYYPFTWDGSLHFLPLLVIPTSSIMNVAAGINNLGEVVGTFQYGTDYPLAFLYHPGTQTLEYLRTLGGDGSNAYAINNHSQIVGSSTTAQGDLHAFLWDPVNGMQDLGTLGGECEAYGLNDSGQVVGAFGDFSVEGGTTAFLWTSSGGMKDLNSLVVNLPPGTSLISANGINQQGWIVGNTDAGVAFLLTPRPALPFLQLLLN
jgi:probable HAF family extracellular repeat protein